MCVCAHTHKNTLLVYTRLNFFVCVTHKCFCVGFCMHRMVLCRILDNVGAVPKRMDGWRNFFSEHIVKNTYIPPPSPLSPKTPKESSMHQFFGFLCSGRKQKMELLIGLTSPRCCCSARSGQHCSYDECLISRNTSQIAKLYLP